MGNSDGISREVGTELLFENDRVKVWSMALEPGQTSPYHRHDNDYVFVYTTPSRISGGQGEVREFDEGYVQYTEVGGGIEHSITNVSDERHHQIIVEMKGGSVSAAAQTPENNGRSRSTG